MADWTHKDSASFEDLSPGYGMGELMEYRKGTASLGAEQIGFSRQMIKPNQRQPFGHKHGSHEEVIFVLTGGGRIKLDDEIVDLRPHDVLRIGPSVMRAMEADSTGIEYLVIGPVGRDEGSELVKGWWE